MIVPKMLPMMNISQQLRTYHPSPEAGVGAGCEDRQQFQITAGGDANGGAVHHERRSDHAQPRGSRRLYLDALGLPLTVETDGYLHSEDIDGSKSFGVWPYRPAALGYRTRGWLRIAVGKGASRPWRRLHHPHRHTVPGGLRRTPFGQHDEGSPAVHGVSSGAAGRRSDGCVGGFCGPPRQRR